MTTPGTPEEAPEPTADGEPSPPAPLPRRTFLKGLALGAGGAAVLAGTGVGIYEWVSSSSSSPSAKALPEALRFHSRPDLMPPVVTIVIPAGETAPGFVFATPSGPGQSGPLIMDNEGQPVWFQPVKPVPGVSITAATNFKVQQFKGEPVLTWWEGEVVLPGGYGKGEYVIADTSYREITRVHAVGKGLKGDLHEFILSPDGVAYFTIYHPTKANLTSIGGAPNGTLLASMIQGVDVNTQAVVFNWDPREHIALDESYEPPSTIGTKDGEYDWLHLNSIDVTPDGNLLISARHTSTIYKVDRSTGKILWRLNGKKSDFTMGSNTQFFFQHDARTYPDGAITLFDDGAGPPNAALRSRGLRLALDFTTMSATLAEEYLPIPAYLTTSQGSVQVLSNSNVFVGWGSEPYFSEYTAKGQPLFVAQLPSKFVSYRGFRFPWTAQPDDQPAIATGRDAKGGLTVYTSWNGATQVKTWRILAGDSAQSLTQVASAPKKGFETAIPVATKKGFVRTEALDEHFRVLGQSKLIRI